MKLDRAINILRNKPKGYKQYLLSLISERFHLGRSLGRPVSITIEPTNICNLRCPICETGSGKLKRKQGKMTYEDFVKIMDKIGPSANCLLFYYMGEPFLNKDAYRMIRYAREMGLYVTTCTNGDLIDPNALYESGINHISFQIGGITQKTHEVYRVNSNLSKIFKNIESYLDLIQRYGKRDGEHEVELGLIVMKQNESEIDNFLKLGKELGVMATLINPCVRSLEQANNFLPECETYWLYNKEVFKERGDFVVKRYFPWNSCPWIYYNITIQVDGNVVPCCRDAQGDYVLGNLLTESLEDVWNGKRFREWRFRLRRVGDPHPLCRLCPGYGPPDLK